MSADTRRRTVEELRVLYLTHPRLRDVLVEGPSDVRFLRWFLREIHAGANVSVYEIDKRVTADADVVRAVHPEVNKRGRLVYVADAAEQWGKERSGVTCVVDADFDVFRGSPLSEALLTTDFPAMEGYSLQQRPFAKFVAEFVEGDTQADAVIDELLPLWLRLFCLRYVLHVHSNGESLVKGFAAKCVKPGATQAFDAGSLIQSSIGGKRAEVERLEALYEEQLAQNPAPSLTLVRGHDIAPVLIKFLDLTGELKSSATVEHLLRACVELVDVETMPMFEQLRRRVVTEAVRC